MMREEKIGFVRKTKCLKNQTGSKILRKTFKLYYKKCTLLLKNRAVFCYLILSKFSSKQALCNLTIYKSRATKMYMKVVEVNPKAKALRHSKVEAVYKFDD